MQKFLWYGWVGLILMAAGWTGNWLLDGPRTHILFFPQWFGLILFIDAVNFKRTATSFLTRSPRRFYFSFLLSVPFWWLFELINLRNGNWIYQGREHFTDLQFFLLASINFSTVIPAVFEMTEFLCSFRWARHLTRGPVIRRNTKTSKILILLGCAMLALDLLMPKIFHLFIWVSLYLILEGINIRLNNKTLVQFTENGNWRPLYMLAIGCISCGLLWEFWNYYSYPRWIYRIPFVDFWRVFEMPILGYLGYIPFSFEIYAMYVLITRTKSNSVFLNFIE